MAEKLTPQQQMAVNNQGGKLLVSAAAGSGKTKVLVDRLMRYLTDPVHPENIDAFLMITYTKAAAAELRGKIAAKLSERIAQDPDNRHLQRQLQRLYLTKISTVHAFCGDLLREYAYRLDIPGDFRVADENECAELRISVVNQVLENAYATAEENPGFLAFIDSQGYGRNDNKVPEIVLKVFDSARCHLNPDQWLEQCLRMSQEQDVSDASQTVYGRYLMDRLFEFLDLQIPAMQRCVDRLALDKDMEKAVVLLRENVASLQALRACRTWDSVVEHRNVDFGTLRFPKKVADEELVQRVKAVRNYCKSELGKVTRPFADVSSRVRSDLSNCFDAAKGLIDMVRRFAGEYDRAKRNRRILDFSDLEHLTLDLLWGKSRGNLSSVAVEIGDRFREVMVDEYQDSNEVQDAIYRALTEKRQNLFMVGDVKQSIYQFRLADPGIFLQKYSEYVPAADAEPGQGRKVVLSSNFRSSGGVLAAANDVFRTCMCPEVGGLHYGDDEALYEGLDHVSLGEPEAELYCIDVQESSYDEEAAFVADKIRSMLDEGCLVRAGDKLRPVMPEDIVILLRSPGSCGIHFQRALERIGIRCASGGGVDLLQTEEVGTLRCLLQAINNPRLDIPLIGAMASPAFGFDADDLAQIRSGNKRDSFYDALLSSKNEKARSFIRKLHRFREIARRNSLTGLLEEIWLQTGMDDLYAAMDGGDQRRENLHMFFQLASDLEAGDHGDLCRFLEYLDNIQEKGLITTGGDAAAGAVTIMSIHKSKGLEFPVVFLCDLGRSFNMSDLQAPVLCHKELGLGLVTVDHEKRIRYPSLSKRAIAAQIRTERLSEEMRVLYVAMTRPKDRLIMTYASNRLEKDLAEMVQRMDLGGRKMLIQGAVCPGEWILLTALERTESGELFALGGNPQNTVAGEPAWKIRVVRAPKLSGVVTGQKAKEEISREFIEKIQQGLSFRYPHCAAVTAPSKQTATQRKGREKDQEVAENTDAPVLTKRIWRKPAFCNSAREGKDYGNAIHAVMQYIDYTACADEAGVKMEIQRLTRQQYISCDQAAMVNCDKIAAFFQSEIGKKLRCGTTCVREFKFSILENGSVYDPALAHEKVLLQGVVDCALIEDDGITIVDFKTDYVTEDTLPVVAERYRPQVEAYCDAMAKIYHRPVKKALLYFFGMNRFEEV